MQTTLYGPGGPTRALPLAVVGQKVVYNNNNAFTLCVLSFIITMKRQKLFRGRVLTPILMHPSEFSENLP